jgi:hypothetical protein
MACGTAADRSVTWHPILLACPAASGLFFVFDRAGCGGGGRGRRPGGRDRARPARAARSVAGSALLGKAKTTTAGCSALPQAAALIP